MDLETPEEDRSVAHPAPTPPHPKRPSQALYVPKHRLHGSKDKPQTQEGAKPRPRPRYTDKARKNEKNKKDKATAAEKASMVGGGEAGELQDGDNEPDLKEEQLQDPELQARGHSDPASMEADVALSLEATALEDEEHEEGTWETLFNDDGDCLDPHLLEEVRFSCRSW